MNPDKTCLHLSRPVNNDANFRALTLMLAQDPVYRSVPLGRLMFLHQWLKHESLILASQSGSVAGLVAWSTIADDVAEKAVIDRRLPQSLHLEPRSRSLVVTMISAAKPSVLKPLVSHLFACHPGQLILFERHSRQGRPIREMGWRDRLGRLQGPSFRAVGD